MVGDDHIITTTVTTSFIYSMVVGSGDWKEGAQLLRVVRFGRYFLHAKCVLERPCGEPNSHVAYWAPM